MAKTVTPLSFGFDAVPKKFIRVNPQNPRDPRSKSVDIYPSDSGTSGAFLVLRDSGTSGALLVRASDVLIRSWVMPAQYQWSGLVEEPLTRSVIGAFYEVYNTLGYGFLENVYSLALERELLARGHRVRRELRIRIAYKGQFLTTQKIDFVVDERLILEIKATEKLSPASGRQLLNYLRASRLEVGLLLHFGPTPSFSRLVATNRPA